MDDMASFLFGKVEREKNCSKDKTYLLVLIEACPVVIHDTNIYSNSFLRMFIR